MKNLSAIIKIITYVCVLIFTLTTKVSAQLNGVYTIDKTLAASTSNYQNFTSAIGDLNTGTRTDGGPVNGPGISANVTFNVPAGEEFHDYKLVLKATGTAADTIAFVKNGSGKNPIIKPPFGTGTQEDGNGGSPSDVMLTLDGASYVTWNGINIADTGSFNAVAGNTDVYRYETGIYIENSSGTQGCQHDRIENCNITMDSLLGSTGGAFGFNFGIYSYSTATALSGTNSYNEFKNDTIPNNNYILYFKGSGTIHDRDNIIKDNYIPKYGMGVTETWGNGTYAITLFGNEDSAVIANNYIGGNRLNTATSEYGIAVWGYGSGGTNTGCTSLTLMGNTVLNTNWTNAEYDGGGIGIFNTVDGTININNNNIGYVTPWFDATVAYGIEMDCAAGCSVLNVTGNYIHDIIHPGETGCAPCSQPNDAMAIFDWYTSGTKTYSRNHFENIEITSPKNINGSVYGIFEEGSPIAKMDSNRFDNFSNTATEITGYYGGNIYFSNSVPATLTRDTIDHFTYTGTGDAAQGTGYPYAFYTNATYNYCVVHDISAPVGASGAYGFSGGGTINNCKIYNISASGTNNAYGVTSSSGVTLNNDTIYGITSVSGTAAGVYTTSGTVNMYGNMIYDFSSTNASGLAFGVLIPSTASNSNIINNMINGTLPSTGTTYRPLMISGSTVNIWFNSININNGSPSSINSCIYLTGIISGFDIRDNIFSYSAASGSGQPFYSLSSGGSPPAAFDYNIFYNAASTNEATFNGTTYTNSTVIGGGGYNSNSQVTLPNFIDSDNLHITAQCPRGIQIVSVTTDIDGQTRVNPPCIGADEIPPSANSFSVDTPVCSGSTITLTATSSTSYLWNTGDTTSSIQITPTQDTTYSVQVKSGVCSAIDSFVVTITTSFSVDITPVSPIVCRRTKCYPFRK